MFIYVLRLLLAAYFVRYYKAFLKPSSIDALTMNQTDYINQLRGLCQKTKNQYRKTLIDSNALHIERDYQITFSKVAHVAFLLQLVMIITSALLVRHLGYLAFILGVCVLHITEHLIMIQFYEGVENKTMLFVDRVIFTVNYATYALIILSLVLL